MVHVVHRREFIAGLGAGLATLGYPYAALAGTPLHLGSSGQPGPSGCFVAADTGIFAANGIDFEFVLIGLDPNTPAALVSGSIDVGVATVSTVLQAAENGLDIVVIGGAAVSNKDKVDYGIIVRKDRGIVKPQDLVGKTIGVPGIGAVFDIMLRAWLEQKGIDEKAVKIVEATLPTQLDLLKAGTVDAVVCSIPFSTHILSSGVGDMLVPLPAELPNYLPLNLYVVRREWAQKNVELLAAFRKSVKAGVSKAEADEAQLRASIGKYLKLPPAVLANLGLPTLRFEVSESGINWWIEEMKRQGRISNIKAADVIYP